MIDCVEYPLLDGYVNRFMVTEVFVEPRRFERLCCRGGLMSG